jgi:hypothetical protein
MEIIGKVKLIRDEQSFASGFTKREFVITTEEQYPQDIQFELLKEKGTKEQELNAIKVTTINQMWSSELENLLEQYLEYKEARQRLMDGEETKSSKKKVVSKGKKVVKNLIVLDE